MLFNFIRNITSDIHLVISFYTSNDSSRIVIGNDHCSLQNGTNSLRKFSGSSNLLHILWVKLVLIGYRANLVLRGPPYSRSAVGKGDLPVPDPWSRVKRASGKEINVALELQNWRWQGTSNTTASPSDASTSSSTSNISRLFITTFC